MVWALLLGGGGAGPLTAQDGGCPAPIEEFSPLAVAPAVGAGGVTRDTVIRVEYPDGGVPDDLDAPLVELWVADGGSRVTGRIERPGSGWVFFVPEAPLEPETAYEGIARGLERDLPFRFRTGSRFDQGPPSPVAIEAVVVRASSGRPSCEESSGYGFSVLFQPSEEDGPPASVEYFLYQSRGPGLQAPRLLGRTRGFGAGTLAVGFSLPSEEADEPLCLSIVALDGVGRSSGPGPLRCIDPVQEDFFVSACRLGASARGGLLPGGLLCLLLLRRLRGRQRRPERSARVLG